VFLVSYGYIGVYGLLSIEVLLDDENIDNYLFYLICCSVHPFFLFSFLFVSDQLLLILTCTADFSIQLDDRL
jgi:hypothetical protein